VAAQLVVEGVDDKRLVIKGYGTTEPLVAETSQISTQCNQCVTFAVVAAPK
jgi:outer membrane protein OmpA-like peptidoglycan-associated protein